MDTKSQSHKQISSNLTLFQDRSLGKGSYGTVWEGQIRRPGQTPEFTRVAIKEIRYDSNEAIKNSALLEVKTLRGLDHPNIVRFYDSVVLEDQKVIYIALELCSQGDLSNLISSPIFSSKTIFQKEKEAKILFKDIVEGLAYLHSSKMSHRDIKPLNILIGKDNLLKLTDFGTAGIASQDNLNQTKGVGTPYYVSPEMCDRFVRDYDALKSDIWSLGILLYKLIQGEEFWKKCRGIRDLEEALEDFDGLNSSKVSKMSPELQDLLEKMLQKDPKNRLSCLKILDSEWVSDSMLDLGMTAQNLISSYLPEKTNIVDDLVRYCGLQTREKISKTIFEKFRELSKIKDGIIELKVKDCIISKRLYLYTLVKILKLIDHLLFKVEESNSQNLKIIDFLSKDCKGEIKYFVKSTLEEVREMAGIIEGEGEGSRMGDEELVKGYLRYCENIISDDFTGSDDENLGKSYQQTSYVVKLILLYYDWIKFEVKIDKEAIKGGGMDGVLNQKQKEELEKRATSQNILQEAGRQYCKMEDSEVVKRVKRYPRLVDVRVEVGADDQEKVEELRGQLKRQVIAIQKRGERLDSFQSLEFLNNLQSLQFQQGSKIGGKEERGVTLYFVINEFYQIRNFQMG